MRFRILENEDGQYKVQRKGWIFWHDVGHCRDGWFHCGTASIVATRGEAESIIQECEAELRQATWREVGGKVLPPRPWPNPPEPPPDRIFVKGGA